MECLKIGIHAFTTKLPVNVHFLFCADIAMIYIGEYRCKLVNIGSTYIRSQHM